jgi:hypothetical protein
MGKLLNNSDEENNANYIFIGGATMLCLFIVIGAFLSSRKVVCS